MILAFKLVVVPAVVVLATLAGRRFGRIASGWLVGLPLTSGPIAAFYAVEHGRRFAAGAGVGSLGGAIAEVVFCAAYAATARRRGWRSAVLAASCAFAVTAAALRLLAPGPETDDVLVLAAAAIAALIAGLRLVPPVEPLDEVQVLPSRFDLPFRAVTATGFLLALTALATTLGPQLAGLVAVYPLYTVVLTAFAHAHGGEAEGVQVLRGLILGLFAFVCFYTALPLLLVRTGTAPAFAAAFAASLIVQAGSLVPLLRAQAAA